MRQEISSKPLFAFKKALYQYGQAVSTLLSIYFGIPRFLHKIIKINSINVETFDLGIWSSLAFTRGSWTNFSTTYCAWNFKKNISMLPSTN